MMPQTEGCCSDYFTALPANASVPEPGLGFQGRNSSPPLVLVWEMVGDGSPRWLRRWGPGDYWDEPSPALA
jgi:hypothetical protein